MEEKREKRRSFCVKLLPTFTMKNWALPSFIWVYCVLLNIKSGQMVRKSGQMVSFEIKSGQRNRQKSPQKRAKRGYFGVKTGIFDVFGAIFELRGQMPTFFLY